jgi:tetratricopeptide (TPR) repeat protein
METTECLISLACALLLSGCVSLQVAGQVQAGREALLRNNPTQALTFLEQAVQTNPQYVYEAASFREGVWTYLGRAQYATGNLQDARRSFERALALHKDDYLARLYLGLTLARAGDRSAAALKQIESGLKGLRDWLQYMNDTDPFDAFWDPLGEIRSEIDKDLTMISAKDIGWTKLISSGEWVGKRMEEEIDKVRRDERRKYENDRDRAPRVMSDLVVAPSA